MRLVKALVLLVPFVALVACGGSVSRLETGDSGPAGDGGPNPTCPAASGITNGVSCFEPGESCPGAYGQPQCNGPSIPVECTCESGSWQCPVLSGGIACPPPPISTCPVSNAVTPGGHCEVDPVLQCVSNIPIPSCDSFAGYESCNCMDNAWQCPEYGGPACIVDAGESCPDPNSTFAGAGCATYGIPCGGDPQSCGAGVVYDALECVGGIWEVVAGTSCDVDSGYVGDGGFFVDAEGPDGGI